MKLKNFDVETKIDEINYTMIDVAKAAISEARDCNTWSSHNINPDEIEDGCAIPFNYIKRNGKYERDLVKIVNSFCDTSYDERNVIVISIEQCVYAAIDAAYNIVHTDALNIECMIRSGYRDMYVPTDQNNYDWYDFNFYEHSVYWRELVKIAATLCPRYYPALRTLLKQEFRYLCK